MNPAVYTTSIFFRGKVQNIPMKEFCAKTVSSITIKMGHFWYWAEVLLSSRCTSISRSSRPPFTRIPGSICVRTATRQIRFATITASSRTSRDTP
ncbi:unnamed protein product [Haemonchus placei]|uniref:Uncharacterized protein n=1 Tax=Haemonchus placei TaxID=6290 RepID=A0A0N4W934_HAEPC|nr:unnamed protein product [Haemonchus placei]